MTIAEQIEQLRAENTRLMAQVAAAPKERALTMKVSEKGALSVYGMGRFPVTLYKTQWIRLIQAIPDLSAFIKANDAKLITKI